MVNIFRGIQGKPLQYLAVIVVNICIIADGMHFGWSSATLPHLIGGNFTFRITAGEGSLLVALLPVGTLAGSLLGEFILDIIGRKSVILISSIPLTASWLLIALGPHKYFYFVSRILAGLVDGLVYTSIPPYTAEISDPKIRGLLGSSIMVSLALGMLVINVLYFFLNESIIITAYLAAGLSFTSFLLVPFIPESPYYYILKRDLVAAEYNLKRLRGQNDVREELSRIYSGIFNNEIDQAKQCDWLVLRKYRKFFVISIGLTLVQHLSGVIAIQSYYETIVLEQIFLLPKICNVIFFFNNFLSTLNFIFWVDYCGRKPLLLISITVSCLALLVNGTYLLCKKFLDLHSASLDSLELISILVFISAYNSGLQAIPILVTSEIFPTVIKPKAHCISNITFSLVSIGVTLAFGWLIENVGVYVPFYIFGVNCFLSIFFIVKFMPETKYKNLEEIQLELKL